MQLDSKIFVAGHRGLSGSAIVEALSQKGYKNLILKTHKELDLSDFNATSEFFKNERPEFVFLSAAKVGGIIANNTYRADFIYQNLAIQNSVIYNSYKFSVKKLLFLGSSCIYPKNAPQPIKEESLLTSELEYTNEPYAIAKIAGLKMCESFNLQYNTNFISLMPTNLYGENDNFDFQNSHVLPALLRKIHLAKLLEANDLSGVAKDLGVLECDAVESLAKLGVSKSGVEIWGSGNPRREFLHSQDLADACVFIMQSVDFKDLVGDKKEVRNTHINIGSGSDISIKELALLIKKIVGFKGELYFNTNKPDGTMRKLMDISKIKKLGWNPKINLDSGIKEVYKWYLNR
ncbi:MAG: GDP-L-fucose synthase [Helicobacter sp.]|nr:GDP-L-fucose synthase [Helicobacter sp.]